MKWIAVTLLVSLLQSLHKKSIVALIRGTSLRPWPAASGLVRALNGPCTLPVYLEVSPMLARLSTHLACLPPPLQSLPPPSPPPPPLAPAPLPRHSKFDALGSGPCREFSVRVTALLNMASDGMILTNHDHQIRVGVLTGKNAKNTHRKKKKGGGGDFADVSVNWFSPAASPDPRPDRLAFCVVASPEPSGFCSLSKATLVAFHFPTGLRSCIRGSAVEVKSARHRVYRRAEDERSLCALNNSCPSPLVRAENYNWPRRR